MKQSITLLVALLCLNSAFARPVEFNDTWQSYLNDHRDDLQSFVNIDLETFLDANPSFVDGWGRTIFRDRSDTFSTFSRTVQTTTYTTTLLPNWHDILDVDRWMDAVDIFEAMGWENANSQYWLGPYGWDRDDEIQLGASICSEYNDEPDYPDYPDYPQYDQPKDFGGEGCSEQITGEEVEEQIVSERKKDDAEIVFDLSPRVFFDFNYSKKIVSMVPFVEKAQKSLIGKNQTVTLNRVEDGKVQVSRSLGMSAGVGPAAAWQYRNVTGLRDYLGASIGLVPVVGRNMHTVQIVDRKDLENMTYPRLPRTIERLDEMIDGAAVTYADHGGIMFSAGPALGFASLSGNYVAQGEWTTTIKKLTDRKVFVERKTGKIKSFGMALQVGLGSLQRSEYLNDDQGFSFLMDLDNEEVFKAFSDFIKGDMTPAQSLVLEGNTDLVQVRTESRSTKAMLSGMSFGIPYIMEFNRTTGDVYTKGETFFHPDQRKSEVSYGAYTDTRQRDIFFFDRTRGKAFYGVSYVTTEKDGSAKNGHYGQFLYRAEYDRMNARKMKSVMDIIARDFGFKNEVKVNVPEDGNFGYTAVSISSKFPRASMESLMRLVRLESGDVKLVKLARKFVTAYFEAGDEFGVCATEEHMITCENRLAKETKKAAWTMVWALKEMNKRDQMSRKFAAAYGAFGKAMMKNQFAFQTVFSLLKGRGVSLKLNIQGENLPMLNKEINWIPEVQ